MAAESRDDTIRRLADEGKLIAYFGYGSLVNPYTHRTEIITYSRARVPGWRRTFRARPDLHPDPIAFLTSSPISQPADRVLDGLLVFDHVDNLDALDIREAGYERHRLEPGAIDVERDIPVGCPVYIYEGMASARPDLRHAILHSYLDAVLQGYHLIYGMEGVDGFLQSTGGLDLPVLSDRARPRYPRAVTLDPAERAMIDAKTAHMQFIDHLD
jgi:hypothetical protein